MRFVAFGNNQLGVWERPSAGAGWRLNFTVPSSAAVKVPDVVGVLGVVPTAAAGLVESPSVALTTTLLYQVALAIPAKKDAKIQVLGFTSQLADSGGY